MRRAFVTGITGQDGYYLSKLLLSKGYEVHGLVRHRSDDLDSRIVQHVGDVYDICDVQEALDESSPDEIYNLAAQSSVSQSFYSPEKTFTTTALGALNVLERVRALGMWNCRIFQASSSEMFGDAAPPQDERTLFKPRSPYAVAKIAAHNTVKVYREAYKMFAVSGILFNHDSERRPEAFVTRKITKAVARIYHGQQTELVLGNLEARRDWGHAEDYVEAMWLMLQQAAPEDFVIATGRTHSVSDFVERAFSYVDLDWTKYVRVDPNLLRTSDVPEMRGDASKAREKLRWQPKIGFDDLVQRMVEHDLALGDCA